MVEEYTLEVDANVAEVMDTNTSVSDGIIQEWRSKVVMAPDGTIHNKQTLLKSIHNPAGMIILSSPLSMDHNSRVQGKSRHGGNVMTEEGTTVARAFNLAQGYNPSAQFEDTAEGTDKYMFDDALVLLIKAKENSMSPQRTRLAIGRAKSFGKMGDHAKESWMSIDDINKFHVTVAIEEATEVLTSAGEVGLQVIGKPLALLQKVSATSVIFTKPKVEIFQGASVDADDIDMNEVGLFYAWVFLLKDLQLIYEMLTTGQGVDAQSAGNTPIPILKAGGNNLFVVDSSLEQEYLSVCSLCSPPYTVGKVGLDISVVVRILRLGEDATPAEPCGWCGGGECSVKVTGSSKQEKVVVECKKITNLPTFSLAIASKKMSKYPSTNHPVLCPGGCKNFIWSYNIMQHLVHSRLCSARISTVDPKVKMHLLFTDELDQSINKNDTERVRLRSLFKIYINGQKLL